jgi:hypothetical protein
MQEPSVCFVSHLHELPKDPVLPRKGGSEYEGRKDEYGLSPRDIGVINEELVPKAFNRIFGQSLAFVGVGIIIRC